MRRTAVIAGAALLWLVLQLVLVVWWATVIERQARRIADLQALGGAGQELAGVQWARTRLMLIGESSTFLALLLAIPHALRDPLSDSDADFASAQGKAISAALDYALKTLAGAPGRSVAVPGAVLEQVRLSARHSVGLDVVISLYVAGRELLGDIVAADAERHGTDAGRAVQAVLGSLLRKLVPIIARTYHEEAERLRRSQRQRRADRIRGLLDGESVDVASLGYDFDGWHTAVIISGAEAPAARSALGRLSCQALFVTQHEDREIRPAGCLPGCLVRDR